jgi:hypothetical protein
MRISQSHRARMESLIAYLVPTAERVEHNVGAARDLHS